jgi:hypothetical protein
LKLEIVLKRVDHVVWHLDYVILVAGQGSQSLIVDHELAVRIDVEGFAYKT